MFTCFNAETADQAWRMAAETLLRGGNSRLQEGRAGNAREILHCAISIRDPRARWVLSRKPAINPAFAIVESFWILAGRDDAKLLNFWNPALPRFAGATDNYSGAYGHRLRRNFGRDQIQDAFNALAANPHGRQVVLQIWDPRTDIPLPDGRPTASDVPCNLCSSIKIRDGRLEWLQVLRSNDVFRGLPYNLVQFTILQEILAGWLGVDLGSYNHIADSLHVYEADLNTFSVGDITRDDLCQASLAMSKTDFEKMLPVLVDALERLASENLTQQEFSKICETLALPPGYSDLLLIAAADSARRRSWLEEEQRAVAACTHPTLRQAWVNWADRMSNRLL